MKKGVTQTDVQKSDVAARNDGGHEHVYDAAAVAPDGSVKGRAGGARAHLERCAVLQEERCQLYVAFSASDVQW